MEVVADSGYYSQTQLKDCQEEGLTPYVAIPDKSGSNKKVGRFCRHDFIYDKERDVYQCPAGNDLEKQSCQRKRGLLYFKYVSNSKCCKKCELKNKCLPEKMPYRQLYRWEHEEIVEDHQKRMRQHGRVYMKKRASLGEHPFGTFKLWLGWAHFLMRGMEKVRAEMSLLMLSYNFKRALNIIGIDAFREYCLQRGVKSAPSKAGIYLNFLFIALLTVISFFYHRNRKKIPQTHNLKLSDAQPSNSLFEGY